MATVKSRRRTSRAGRGCLGRASHGPRAGVIYGNNQPPLNICSIAELRQRIYAGKFLTSLYDVDVDGTKHRVIPRDFQVDPVRAADPCGFRRPGEGATIGCAFPFGDHLSVARHARRHCQYRDLAADVRCPADAIPEAFDVTGLEINHSRHLSDIRLPPNVRPFMRVDATLVTIVPPSGYAEEMKAAAEAAAAAAAAAATAAAAPAAPTGAPGAAPATPSAPAGGGDKK
jgi:large subunit ribosomal protein L25